MAAAIITLIVTAGVVLAVGGVCLTVLYGNGRLRYRENRSVQAARDSLAITRLRAEEDLIQLAHSRVLDRFRDQKELTPGEIETELKTIRGSQPKRGEVL